MAPPSIDQALATIKTIKEDSDAQFLALKRENAVGTLVFSGRGVPRKKSGEKLIETFLPVISSAFNLHVPPMYVSSIRRENKDRRSPIVIKFVHSHSTGPYFDLLNPSLKNLSARAGLNIWRYQTKQDSDLRYSLKKLCEAGLIYRSKVNREHLNIVQVNMGDMFHVVLNGSDLLELVSQLGDPLAYEKVSRYLLTGELPPTDKPSTSEPEENVQKTMDTD